jgi:MarR family transcriptional regulator for hemolysin
MDRRTRNTLLQEDDRIALLRRLTRLGNAWRREVDQDLKRFGLTDASWRPILALGNLQAPVRQGDLLRILDMDPASLARLLEVLERDGLVERIEDPDDRRFKLVRITPPGQAIHREVAAVALAVGDRVLAGVSPAQLGICHDVLDQIEQALRPADEREPATPSRPSGDPEP